MLIYTTVYDSPSSSSSIKMNVFPPTVNLSSSLGLTLSNDRLGGEGGIHVVHLHVHAHSVGGRKAGREGEYM